MQQLLDPSSLPLAVLALFMLIAAFAGLVHGTLGLGFPLVCTPLLALLTDVRTAILLTLLPTVCVNVLSIFKGGRWRLSLGRYWPLAAYSVLGSLLGTQLLIVAQPEPFRLLLAAMILMYVNLQLFTGLRLGWVKTRPRAAMGVFGVVAGFMAGTTNVMVPVLIVYALEAGLASTLMVQVFNLCFLAGKLTQAATFISAGVVQLDDLLSTLPLAASAVIGLYSGMSVRRLVGADTYRGWLNKMLYLFAALLLVQFAVGLVGRG